MLIMSYLILRGAFPRISFMNTSIITHISFDCKQIISFFTFDTKGINFSHFDCLSSIYRRAFIIAAATVLPPFLPIAAMHGMPLLTIISFD